MNGVVDLISRCVPVAGSQDSPGWGLSNDTICTQINERILRDGFRSFPSGHSGLGFAGLGFLAFYAAGKLQIWDGKGYTVGLVFHCDYLPWCFNSCVQAKSWLVAVPLVGATLIAVSRTMDYRRKLNTCVHFAYAVLSFSTRPLGRCPGWLFVG